MRPRQTAMPFESGTQDTAVTQYAGGIGYQVSTRSRIVEHLDFSIHASRSLSRDLGQNLVFRQTAAEDTLIQVPLRVAGGSIVGFESRGVFRPAASATLGVTLGGQRLAYDWSAGRESASRVTTGAEWTQQLGKGYRFTAGASTYAAQRTFTVSAIRTSAGQQFGLTLTSVRGRDGAPHDTQLRWNHSFTWGHDSIVPSNVGGSAPEVQAYNGREMLELVSTRPAFIPAQVIARVDTTVTQTRLVALAREGLPSGTRVDAATATVTLSDPVATILLVTRNGVPVENTGQFVVANDRLEVRPRAMEPPKPGLADEYVVTLENLAGGVTAVTVTVTVSAGSVRIDRITVTTDARRDAPDDLTFESPGGVPLNTILTSNAVTIAGINVPVSITVTDGEYAVDDGAFRTAPGSVINGQTVRVRHRSASTTATRTTTVLTAGRTMARFSSVTEADTLPDPFSFAAVDSVQPGEVVTSNSVEMRGIDGPAPVTIVGGEYAIDAGAFTAGPGTIVNGQHVRVRVTASSRFRTTTLASITVGGRVAAFAVTTIDKPPVEPEPDDPEPVTPNPPDTSPTAFTFTPQTDVALSTTIASHTITVSGIDAAAPISVSGGEYAINGGSYTTAAGTVSNGQTVTVRHTSSASYATTTTATLTIGGVSGTFSVTTRAADTTPGSFSLTAQTNIELSTVVVSNTITVSGIEAAATISVSGGGEYAINGGTYASSAGTVSNGQTVTVRQRSANQFSTTSTATLTIGGVSGTFSVTTAAPDTTPDAFSFTTQSNVSVNTAIVSNTITISGINSASTVSISGGEYAIQGNNYTSSAGTITDGQTIKVRVTSSSSFSTPTTATLTIGGVSGTFSVTTEAMDTTPDAFSF